jgi:hypothetical protein
MAKKKWSSMKNKIVCTAHDVSKCLNCGQRLFVPNWFDKEDIENLLGHKITDKQFAILCDCGDMMMADEVSDLVRDTAERIIKSGEENQ